MIDKKFVEFLFNGASIERWNDMLRPIDFIELDKQSHKVIIAYIIANIEEKERGKKIDWKVLIEGSIFEYFRNIALTDIKRPVISYLYKKKKNEINNYVIDKFEKYLKEFDIDFFKRFKSYYLDETNNRIERKILRAASTIATLYEFEMLMEFNRKIHPVDKIYNDLLNEAWNYLEFKAVERILNKQKPYEFINFCGQLRFQKRWAQTPRVPKTSVLGHIFLVALFTHFFLIKLKVCDKGVYYTFFNALFHDLPEALTRDIISPIKMGIKGLDETIKEYERNEIEQRLLPALTPFLRDEIKLYIIDEFENKYFEDNEYRYFNSNNETDKSFSKDYISYEDSISENKKISVKDKSKFYKDIKKTRMLGENINTFLKKYNNNDYKPIFGKIVRVADHFAAFLEAVYSKKHGISSGYIDEAIERYVKMYEKVKIGDIELGKSLFF